jgi:hypothetical protein
MRLIQPKDRIPKIVHPALIPPESDLSLEEPGGQGTAALMDCSLPWDPETKTVILRRNRQPSGDELVSTNVTWRTILGSPGGWNWGYRGSGAQDLAINILTQFIPAGTDGFEPIVGQRGHCSRTAHQLGPNFVAQFLVGLPHRGGEILGSDIESWIQKERGVKVNSPSLPRLAAFTLEPTASGFERGRIRDEPKRTVATLGFQILDLTKEFENNSKEFEKRLTEVQRDALAATKQSMRGVSNRRQIRAAPYRSLFALAHSLHALDVEYFRSEIEGRDPNTAPLIRTLPAKLQQVVEERVRLHEQKARNTADIVTNIPHDEIVRAAAKQDLQGLTVSALGSTLVLSGELFDIQDAARGIFDPTDSFVRIHQVGGLATTVNIRGTPVDLLLLPLERRDFDLKTILEERQVIIHERQHRLWARGSAPNTEIVPTNPDQKLRYHAKECAQILYSSFMDEFTAMVYDGNLSNLRYLNLRGSNYDYVRSQREHLIEDLRTKNPGRTEGNLQSTYDKVAASFLDATRKFTDVFHSFDQPSQIVVMRALELCPPHEAYKHIVRMRDLAPELGLTLKASTR